MALIDRLKTLPYFSASALKIAYKTGGMGGLTYQPLQARILVTAMAQLELRGEIRIDLVKPRQIRASTLFMSLGYSEMLLMPATQVLTITNKGSVTDELFRTIKRFHDHLPREMWTKPRKDNDDELYLENESLMKVATAGSDGARGFPCRMLEASEVGRYTTRQAKDYTEGALQTLASGKDTIGIEESTSGGYGNYFHEKALAGWDTNRNCPNRKERWWTLFYGWNEEPEYRLEPFKDWEPNDEEKTLQAIYSLRNDQLFWRYDKIRNEFRGSVSAFNREYPISFDSAFEDASGTLFDSIAVHLARKNRISPPDGAPGVLGVDPAGGGNRTAAVLRKSTVVPRYWTTRESDDSATAAWIIRLMNEEQIHTCIIDMGYGHGIYSILRNLGMWNVIGIWANAKASRPELYVNQRTELAAKAKAWMHEGADSKGGVASIPDDDQFCSELRMIPDLEFNSSKGAFFLPSKQDIKENLGNDESPDLFDAFTLTFGYEVKPNEHFQQMVRGSQEPRILSQTDRYFRELQEEGEGGKINPNARFHSIGPKMDKNTR